MGEWKRRDIQYCRFPGHDLTYAHYSKFPSWGLQDLALTKVNHISFNRCHPISSSFTINKSNACTVPCIKTTFQDFSSGLPLNELNKPTASAAVLRQQLLETTTKEYIYVAINILCVVIYCLHEKARSYINEYSPLVLFSWWRNKISWNLIQFTIC